MAERDTVFLFRREARQRTTASFRVDEKPKSRDKASTEGAPTRRIFIEERNPFFTHGTATWRRSTQERQTEEKPQSREKAAKKDLHTDAHVEVTGITRHNGRLALERRKAPPPPPPQKPAHLRKHPIVEKAGDHIERKPLTVSALWGGGEELTVGRFPSGGLYLKRTKPELPPEIILPDISDSSESS